MPEEIFETNIMRMLAAELYFSLSMNASREFYGKSYFSFSQIEKTALDQLVFSGVAGNFQAITPENLRKQTTQQPAGFQVPTGKTDQS
jgi:hypothetical protein